MTVYIEETNIIKAMVIAYLKLVKGHIAAQGSDGDYGLSSEKYAEPMQPGVHSTLPKPNSPK
ncbi:hypothetical protein [Chitinophaga sp. YR627]|uniref:hypothetical protein n=1 Tax=Chitinophaga sp. YR627 TaxID=1881041 RepID=UPI000B7F577D|nr:hypothetical protein [Chitinophaga sp. YR627]